MTFDDAVLQAAILAADIRSCFDNCTVSLEIDYYSFDGQVYATVAAHANGGLGMATERFLGAYPDAIIVEFSHAPDKWTVQKFDLNGVRVKLFAELDDNTCPSCGMLLRRGRCSYCGYGIIVRSEYSDNPPAGI